MTLTDPRAALADQSSFIGYLVGLAGLARVVDELADGHPSESQREPDDFVFALLGLASVGKAIERLAYPTGLQLNSLAEQLPMPSTRWLR